MLYVCKTWSLTLREEWKDIRKQDLEENIWAKEECELRVEEAPQWGAS